MLPSRGCEGRSKRCSKPLLRVKSRRDGDLRVCVAEDYLRREHKVSGNRTPLASCCRGVAAPGSVVATRSCKEFVFLIEPMDR